jgi:hypothetical protein
MDQAQIAFLDQVVERQAAMQVMAGNADHQPQIGLDHVLARREVAGMGGARELTSSAAVNSGVTPISCR